MQIDAPTECPLQKVFIDHQWQLPLEGMVHIFGTPLPNGIVDFDDTARRFNAATGVLSSLGTSASFSSDKVKPVRAPGSKLAMPTRVIVNAD